MNNVYIEMLFATIHNALPLLRLYRVFAIKPRLPSAL